MTEYKFMKLFGITVLLLLFPLCVFAQQVPQDEEAELKQMREAIDKQVEDYENLLNLEDWQVFYVDSIMTHDYEAMRSELKALQEAKVSNAEAYQRTQDKWMEAIYQAYNKVFNEEQWTRYLKSGAAREKKARDKREAKRNQQ